MSTQFASFSYSMPDNCFEAFFLNLSNRNYDLFQQISSLNWGWWFAIDDSCYDKRSAAAQMFDSYYGTEYAPFYPALHARALATDGTERKGAIRTMSELLYNHAIDSRPMLQTLFMEHRARAEHYSNSMAAAMRDRDSYAVDLTRFDRDNISKWCGKVLADSEYLAIAILDHGLRILRDYENRAGWRFDLRTPLAFDTPASLQLLQKAHPINAPEMLLNRAQSLFAKRMAELNLHPFRQFATYRDSFNFWMRHNGTAVFTHRDSESTYLLTPQGMPAIAALNHYTKMPLTVDRYAVPSIDDEWQRIELLNEDDMLVGSWTGHRDSIHPAILDLGWLIAVAMSVVSANLKTGKGTRKLSWTHPVLVAAYTQTSVELAPAILARANKVIHA